jgi:hypothetical protein
MYPIEPKYDKIVVIALEPMNLDSFLIALQLKFCTQNPRPSFELVRLSISNEELSHTNLARFSSVLSSLTSRSKLYILGHGSVGSDFFVNENNPPQKIHLEKLAQFINQYTNKANLRSVNSRSLRISLLACNAGTFSDEIHLDRVNNSSAAKILFYLTRDYPDINYEIAARMGVIGVSSGSPRKKVIDSEKIDTYRRYNNEIACLKSVENDGRLISTARDSAAIAIQRCEESLSSLYYPKKDNLAKVVYTNYHGEQIIKPAYPGVIPWRDEVFATLANCLVGTKAPMKKQGLRLLMSECTLLSGYNLKSHLITAMTEHRRYNLHLHSGFSFLGMRETNTQIQVGRLIASCPFNA